MTDVNAHAILKLVIQYGEEKAAAASADAFALPAAVRRAEQTLATIQRRMNK